MNVMSVLGWCSTAFCLLTMATLEQLVTAQLENVALMKPAVSSSLYNLFVPASVAVNGVTNNDGQCMETEQNDRHPYWRVDLGHTYTISNITVYRRARWSLRIVNVKIYVDGQLCHIIDYNEAFTPPPSPGPPVAISVQCSTPLTGRHVTLVKNYTGDIPAYHPEVLSVCEVQVWATASSSSSPTSLSTSTTRRVTTTNPTPSVTTPTSTQRSVPSSPMTQPTTTTTTTDQGDNDSNSVFGDQSASPPETATTAGVVGGVVGGVLGSLLILSLTVFAIYVVRTKRRREQNRGDNRRPDGGEH